MADNMQFWLTFNNNAESLRLPVNPEVIRVAKTHGYDDVLTTQLGELTVIGTDRLREYTFSAFFPRDYNASYCEYDGFPAPYEATALIERWIETRRPIRLTITGTPINTPVTVRSFSYEERAGHVGDLFYEIALKEYRFTELKKVTEPLPPPPAGAVVSVSGDTPRESGLNPTSPYIVKSGDNLTKIAHALYGNGDRWREIYNANKALIGANPNLIQPGQSLVIPL